MKLRCLQVRIRQTPQRWIVEAFDGNGQRFHRIVCLTEEHARAIRDTMRHYARSGGTSIVARQQTATCATIEYRKLKHGK